MKKCQRNVPVKISTKKENTSNLKGYFLDLDINIKDRKFETEIYDKREAFLFSVVRMPYWDSNMPSRIFYEAGGSEILHVSRTTSSKVMFQKLITTLLRRVRNKAAKTHK